MSSRSRFGRLLGNGKYELLSQIGTGAMGTVWLARHVALDRVVAVKMLGMVTSASSEARQRFLTEARTASLLRHTNSVRILDYAAEGDECWLVMEFLEGRTLADVLAEQSPLVARRAIAITTQALAAVAEAHEYGLVHRDLKPANIMLLPWVDDDGRETEQVKVLDFGIATLSMPFTQAVAGGEVAGTPEYMSPEQAQGLSVDPRSDVYAMGVILHQMLCGEVPFHGDTPMETMVAHINGTPTPARTVNPRISERLESVILRALAKVPAERYAGARAMRAALLELPEAAGLRGDSSPRMRPVTSPGVPRPVSGVAPAPLGQLGLIDTRTATSGSATRPPKRVWWPAALAVLLLAGAGIAFGLSQSDTPVTRHEIARALPPIEVPPTEPRLALADTIAPDTAPAPAPDTVAPTPDTTLAQALDAGPEATPPTEVALVAPVAPVAVVAPVAPVAPVEAKVAPEEAKKDPSKREPKKEPKPTVVAKVEAPPPTDIPVAVHHAPAPVPAPILEKPPEKAPVEPVAPVAPVQPKPQPKPALQASVAVRDLVVKGSLPRSAVQRALDAMRPALEQCYRAAAESAKRDSAGTLTASVVIDVDGNATQIALEPFPLGAFNGCARSALARARSRERPDTGTAIASFVLSITPKPPEQP